VACATQTFRVTKAAWSDGTTTAHFIGFLRMEVGKYKKARVSLILEGSSGNLTVTAGAVLANIESGLASATPVNIPAASPASLAADGASWGSAYGDIDTSKQLIEIGVNAKNGSGTKMEMGLVTLVIDFAES
jgi:hypothetical protein